MRSNHMYLFSHDQYILDYWGEINSDHWCKKAIRDINVILTLSSAQLVVVDIAVLAVINDMLKQKLLSQHQVIVASLNPNDIEGHAVLMQGAKAYVHAYSSLSIWQQVLTQVKNGKIWLGTQLFSRLLSDLAKRLSLQNRWKAGLTASEIDVVERVVLGHPNHLIAKDLDLPEQTVQAHLSSVLTKLNANDRLDLAFKVYISKQGSQTWHFD